MLQGISIEKYPITFSIAEKFFVKMQEIFLSKPADLDKKQKR